MSAFFRRIAAFGALLALPAMLSAQVTHGVKPQLPAPFATKSAGNPPEEEKPPKGFLPTVPTGFQINIFAANFKQPRWLTVAPNGDIFVADTHGGAIYILRDPQHAQVTQVIGGLVFRQGPHMVGVGRARGGVAGDRIPRVYDADNGHDLSPHRRVTGPKTMRDRYNDTTSLPGNRPAAVSES